MTKKEALLKRLNELAKEKDAEKAHGEAEALLLAYIWDKEIIDAYCKIKRWYHK